jgi:hypothetical protein
MPAFRPLHVQYVSKDVRMSGYFSKPKGAREQKNLGNTSLADCFDGLQNKLEFIVFLSAINSSFTVLQ